MNFITEQLDVLIKFIQKNLIRQEQSFNHFERYLILRSHSYWKSNFSKTSNFSSTISRYLSEEEDKFRDGRKIVNQRKKARRKRPIGRTVFPSSRPPFAFFSLLSPLFLFWFFTQLSSDSNPIEPRRDARSWKKKRRKGESGEGNPVWIIDFRAVNESKGGRCLRRLYSRSREARRNKARNKCECLRGTREIRSLLQLKYHAKIYSNWFLLARRLIHYATDSSTLLHIPFG